MPALGAYGVANEYAAGVVAVADDGDGDVAAGVAAGVAAAAADVVVVVVAAAAWHQRQ